MDYWGVKSYECDDAADALDAGFELVHGTRYEELMDDRNPLSYEQVQERLASEHTLAAAIEALQQAAGGPSDDWDDELRLAFVGVIVRHAELKVPIPEAWRQQAATWLESEELDWEDDAAARARRRKTELSLLARSSREPPRPGG